MALSLESERNHLIVVFVILGFGFLLSLIFVQMFQALMVRDLVRLSNYYFEMCAAIVGLNLVLLYFYNAMARKAKMMNRIRR